MVVTKTGMTEIFQLTTSRRGRPSKLYRQHGRNYFNSLPHAEVDHQSYIVNMDEIISTHYLTQR